MSDPQHFLADVDGLNNDFPRNAKRNADRFMEGLLLKSNEGQSAEEVMADATKRLKEMSVAEKVQLWKYQKVHALGLIAFVGEEAIVRFGGGWRMVLGYDAKTLEPWVVAGNGDVRAPFDILDEFEQDPEVFDLKARFGAIMGVPRNRWEMGFDNEKKSN